MENNRETHKRMVAQRIAVVVQDAARLGLVVTVEQVPQQPLAMGNYTTEVSVREARQKATAE